MRRSPVILASLIVLLCTTQTLFAQGSNKQSAASLREKVLSLETTNLESRSELVREIYKQTLARLYAEFSEALQEEISDLGKIQNAVKGTSALSNGELTAQIKQLSLERELVQEKVKTLNVNSAISNQLNSGEVKTSATESARAFSTNDISNWPLKTPAELAKLSAEGVTALSVAADSSNLTRSTETVEPATVVVSFGGHVTDSFGNNLRNATVSLIPLTAAGELGDARKSARTNSAGRYTLIDSAAPEGLYVVKATVGDFVAQEPLTVTRNVNSFPAIDLQLQIRPLGQFSRAIVGFEQAGASSAQHTQKFFMDLTLSAPLAWGKIDPLFGSRARTWGTIRVTSVPQQINTGVAEFAGAFAQKAGLVKVNEVAQGLEFLAGGELRIAKSSDAHHFGSFSGDTSNRFTISLIAGAGVITPFNPRDTLEVFKVFADAPGLPSIPSGKEFVAFVSPDRDRFFRQYYGGLRLRTYYFDYYNDTIPLKRYPATLDITYGQNEAVTGGRMRGGIIRLEGFYPLPYNGLKFINLFGTALIKPSRTKITEPLILEPAPSSVTVPANNVFLLTVPQINRDYYRVGIGIDFISLIDKWRESH